MKQTGLFSRKYYILFHMALLSSQTHYHLHLNKGKKKTIFEIMFQNIHFEDSFWSSYFLIPSEYKDTCDNL